MAFKDRIKEIREVRGKDILPSPDNWRIHPVVQKKALKQVMDEIGVAGIPVCYENAAGQLVALDGHCRLHDVGKNHLWKVAVLDITEEEAKKLIAVYDPISEMADADQNVFVRLLEEVKFTTPSLNALMHDIAADNGITLMGEPDDTSLDGVDGGTTITPVKRKPHYTVVIDCDSESEQEAVLTALCLPTDKKRVSAQDILERD